MKLGFSLLTLFGLTTLVALELATLKTSYMAVFVGAELFVNCAILVTTWGAFLLTGKLRQYCKGFSVASWAFLLFTVFTNTHQNPYYESELAKFTAETIGHELIVRTLGVFDGDVIDPTGHYFQLWFLWSVFNFGLVGGLAALQLNTVGVLKVSIAVDPVESPSK